MFKLPLRDEQLDDQSSESDDTPPALSHLTLLGGVIQAGGEQAKNEPLLDVISDDSDEDSQRLTGLSGGAGMYGRSGG